MSNDNIIFPKYITIFCNDGENNKYLSRMGPTDLRLSKENIDEYCYFEVVEQIKNTNKIKIKVYTTGFGVYTHDNEYVDSSDDYKYQNTRNRNEFEIIRLERDGDNIFAIKSSNGNYVSRWGDAIRAAKKHIDKYCKFKIEEPYINKKIIDVKYESPKTIPEKEIKKSITCFEPRNENYNDEIITTFEETHTEKEISTWNSISGYELSMEIGKKAGLPLIGEIEIKFGAKYNQTNELGGSKEKEKSFKVTTPIKIPPRKKLQ